VLRLLNAILENGLVNHTKFYQASTSELCASSFDQPKPCTRTQLGRFGGRRRRVRPVASGELCPSVVF
jgi:hypothetical protein